MWHQLADKEINGTSPPDLDAERDYTMIRNVLTSMPFWKDVHEYRQVALLREIERVAKIGNGSTT
jgi:hypothetical protein